ncbi:MAG: L-threonylcarbamoyladenylate synthase [Bryobacteraceae bacterium]
MTEIERAADVIRRGGLVAFPTETVYGLGANALDESAVARIFEAKGRPETSPLIVHVDSISMASGLTAGWPEEAERLARRFWPGPLTLVLRKNARVPERVTAGLGPVGLRMPAHPTAQELIRTAGVPIAAPSANRFTELSPTTAEHVRLALGDRIDMILDGGPTRVGIESTVLSLVERPVLLRPGMVTLRELEDCIGQVEVLDSALNSIAREGEAHPSPGMHARHYSPRTPLMIGATRPEDNAAYVWWNRELPAARSVEMPGKPKEYAARLYETLHRLDQEGWDYIAVEAVPDGPEWAAVADRLLRAAQKR